MKKIVILSFILAAFSLSNAPEAAAQNRIGVNGGYNIDNESWFVGGQARLGTAALPVVINPSVETYLDVEGGSIWELDINGLYHIGRDYTTTFTPYVGAGIGVLYFNPEFDEIDSQTDVGLNLVAGADFGNSRLQPFVEARIQFIDGEMPVSVRGGVLFGS